MFKKNKEKISYSFKEVLIIMIVSLLVGFFSAYALLKVINNNNLYSDKIISKFIKAYQTIINNYPEELDKDALIDSAIDAMAEEVGDKYTNYNNENETIAFEETVSGKYEGIGCLVKTGDNGIEVVEVYEDSPASLAGIKVGDIIAKIDDEDYTGKTSSDMATYIKGNSKKKIKITIIRNGEEINIKLKKSTLEVPTVTSKTYNVNNKKVGYLNISVFASVTDKQFSKKLTELEEENIEALVIDLRGNSGGYLSVVTEIASTLLPKGEVIYKLEKESGKVTVKKDKTKEKRTYNIAVIIDASSASASEILASAIKESYHGAVVGVTSYGKGTVQQTLSLDDGTMIKYTIEKWLTPDGNYINEVGVEPTNYIELSNEYLLNPSDETDNQLKEALSIVSK